MSIGSFRVRAVLAFVVLTNSTMTSFANESSKWGLGALTGASMPTGDTSFTRYAYGFILTYHFVPKLDLSLSLANRSSQAGSVSSLFGAMVEFNYHFIDVGPLYFGIRAGVISETVLASGYYFGMGEQIGYDFSISNNLTMGPKFALNYGVGTVTSTWLDMIFQAKYWF